MSAWRFDPPQFTARTEAEIYLKSYLNQLNQQLNYQLQNLTEENLSTTLKRAVSGSVSGAKVVKMGEEDQERVNALRKKLTETAKAVVTAQKTADSAEEMAERNSNALESNVNNLRSEILNTAQTISENYDSKIEQSRQEITQEVSRGFIAKSEDVSAGTSAELVELMNSLISQTDVDWTARFSELTQTVLDNHDEYTEYVENQETYIRLSKKGIEIGMLENNTAAPYSVLLGNEKLAFLQYGSEIAYIQYNKLYITSAEFLDRFSVGSAANGGFFEFVTTQAGLGIKWRDA